MVLCYLEDMTYQQAADALRWSEATTRGRLARGRELLRSRLTRRGVTLAGAGLIVEGLAAPVPAALLATSVRAARRIALGDSIAAGAVSTTTMALARRAARSMAIGRLKAIAASVLVVATMTGLAALGLAGDEPRDSGTVPKAAPAAEVTSDAAKADRIDVRGRVLRPDGRPAAGVVVYTTAPSKTGFWTDPVVRARTAADGSFRFSISAAEAAEAGVGGPGSALTVLAAAEGTGPDWVELNQVPEGELVLRLAEDSVPIVGRIVDLQGRPVVGAKVKISRIVGEGPEGIDPYLKLVREDPFRASNHHFARYFWAAGKRPGYPASVTTDADGRFRLTGIGRERIVDIAVEGPGIQGAALMAMTRDAPAVATPKDAFGAWTVYGARFEHLIPPGRVLTGVVRDRKTGKPLAGLYVHGNGTNALTPTDAEGRYTLAGFPKGKSYGLMVEAGARPPYFATSINVPDTAGLDPIRVDVDCVPGIPMRLKLIDRETGREPPGIGDVAYWPLYPNPHVREVPGYVPVNRGAGPYNQAVRQDDGTYLLGVLPGPGAVVVSAAPGRYRPACVDPRAFFKRETTSPPGERMLHDDRSMLFFAHGEGAGGLAQSQFSAIVLVNPPGDSGPIAAEAVLERDRKREVRVLGPDGDPLDGVSGEGEGVEATKAPGVMTVSGLHPMRPKRFTFRHDGRKLIGFLMARGDEAEPYVVRMQPWGTLSGRLVDAKGQPRPKVHLNPMDWNAARNDPARGVLPPVETDAQGRFRVEGLVPGQSYDALAVDGSFEGYDFGVVFDRIVLGPGEARDLGDVRARTVEQP